MRHFKHDFEMTNKSSEVEDTVQHSEHNIEQNIRLSCSGVEDRVQYWQARWATGQSQWHSEKPHQYLVKYLDQLVTGDAKIRIFLPLCGKAGDLNWLYQAGHTVLGVEGVPFVVEQFFRENKIEHEKTSMQDINGWKFQSKDGRLTIYACDFFLLTPAILGPIDAVYDRGALEAVSPNDRINYVRVMQSLVGPEFRYVLNTYEYDDTMFQGPPRNIPRDEVFNLFADFCEVDILEEEDESDAAADKFNLEWMVKVVYLLKPALQ
ncbi:probable thiopurine S-methyltransferase [Eurytemora carolleeae]|uniref:probable thiopurine S-methyltransferase n=1 Tax=Eurytemora carolleeae TaxID=1294199 RepID=UPI000C7887C6|nr:probable thiopurine S-methyltransferase [Eurytemora carolleeae]|eukprot:XP_023338705.1 probable thiopurine S-methyltransferase [Eurytemora affinis]